MNPFISAALCVILVGHTCGCVPKPSSDELSIRSAVVEVVGPARNTAIATRPVPAKDAVSTTAKSPDTKDFLGAYASPSEIGGFSGTRLIIQKEFDNERLAYRMRSYSDVISSEAIRQDESRGSCLINSDTLYLPEATGYYYDGKPSLHASIERYTLLEINGHKVLLRDDALRALRGENKLYDYGILIKVKDDADVTFDLTVVKSPTIKLLYADPSKPWNDPFVHGSNPR